MITGIGVLFLLLSEIPAKSQQSVFDLDGYLSGIQSMNFQDIQGQWITDNYLHNRLNFHFYPAPWLKGSIQFRNRLIWGDRIETLPGYATMLSADDGIIDLNNNIANGNSYLLNTSTDRLWLQFSHKKVEVTLGRQRINWSQTFVWNPNDLFNAYSFFDIDYPERPGSDAVRIQYYTGLMSSVELAAKADSAGKITAAGLWRFNKWNYDIQLLGGIYQEDHYMAGLGWSGYIKNASFRGEASYFHPSKSFSDTSGTISLALSADYTFSNSLYLQFEMLYNQMENTKEGLNSFYDLYNMSLSARSLSFTEWNLFGQLTYPLTPLLTAGIAGIYYPEYEGYYLGPNLNYSLRDDLYLTAYYQGFSGQFEVPGPFGKARKQRISSSLIFLRLKWSF